MWWAWLSLALVGGADARPLGVSCRNERNAEVDWYILYKAPQLKSSHLTGLEHLYIDANGKRRLPSIKDPNGVLANTLRPMFTNSSAGFGFLSYNDQRPQVSGEEEDVLNLDTFGHSKGVVLGDRLTNRAVWLTHSTPKFPLKKDVNNFWPSNGNMNGQTFMCVSLRMNQLQVIGKHLQYIRAFPFDFHIPDDFPTAIRDAANRVHDTPPGRFIYLKTWGNVGLKLWAKSTGTDAKDGDMYVKLAAELGSDMNAQTWGRQTGRDKTYCVMNQYKVMNVEKVHTELSSKSWHRCNDHSKWAVTTANNIHWTCFGDVNRAPSQYQRWGGALCIDNKRINGLFKGFVESLLPCGELPMPCEDPVTSDLLTDIEALAKRMWRIVFGE